MVRVLSGAVLVVLAVGAIVILPPLALLVIAEGVLLLAFAEYADLAARVGAPLPIAVAAAGACSTCAAFAWPGTPIELPIMATTLAVASFVLALRRTGAEAFKSVAAATFASLYLGLPIGALIG